MARLHGAKTGTVPGDRIPFVRKSGCQAQRLTRDFASPPRDGFAFIGKGPSLWPPFVQGSCLRGNGSTSLTYVIDFAVMAIPSSLSPVDSPMTRSVTA